MKRIIPSVLALYTLLAASDAAGEENPCVKYGLTCKGQSKERVVERKVVMRQARAPAVSQIDLSQYVKINSLQTYLPRTEFEELKGKYENTVSLLDQLATSSRDLAGLYDTLDGRQTGLQEQMEALKKNALSDNDHATLELLTGALARDYQALEQLKKNSTEKCRAYDLSFGEMVTSLFGNANSEETLPKKIAALDNRTDLSAQEKVKQKAVLFRDILEATQKATAKTASLERECGDALKKHQESLATYIDNIRYNLTRPKRFGDLEVFTGVQRTGLNDADAGLVGVRAGYGNQWRAYFEAVGFFDLFGSRNTNSSSALEPKSQNLNLERGYQEISTTTGIKDISRKALGELGAGVTRRVSLGPNTFLEVSAGADTYLVETTTTTTQTRNSQLSRNGSNLGDAHYVTGTEEKKEYDLSVTPTMGAGACYKASGPSVGVCVRVEGGYNINDKTPEGRALLGIRF